MRRRPPASADPHRRALVAALAVASAEIELAAARLSNDRPALRAAEDSLRHARAADTAHPGSALAAVCSRFNLSPFERRVLVAAAGLTFDSNFAALVERHSRHRALTFAFALEVFSESHWTAVTPGAPLRRWQLVLPPPADHPLTAPLALDERILHHLLGVEEPDPRVTAFARPLRPELPLAPAQRAAATALAACWRDADDSPVCPAAWLDGATRAERRAVAATAAAELGWETWTCDALPPAAVTPETWRILWEREALLRSAVLVLEVAPHEPPAPELLRLAETIRAPLVLSGGRWPESARPRRAIQVPTPAPADLAALWTHQLGARPAALRETIGRAAVQFHLPLDLALAAAHEAAAAPRRTAGPALWSACRRLARRAIDDVAERIEPRARAADLVLPPGPRALLQDLVHAARHQHRVNEEWGFARRSTRGLGLAALFAGPSGTGKTMAAEVIANELELDLYRIDLSAVVSKYIGDTEKNLRRVFDAADHSGAILLFDEADALFGKRGEVKDSHDRYANIEVGYLLQRMEAYRGLALLTTNLRQSLDDAFTRRLRFIVSFPFPDDAAREQIWRLALPEETPRETLDWARLARLDISGGHIRNIALAAAIQASAENKPVAMRHLVHAARVECAKLERPIAAHEFAGWL